MDLRIELPTGTQDKDGVSRHIAIGQIGRLLETIDEDAVVRVTVCPPPLKPSCPPGDLGPVAPPCPRFDQRPRVDIPSDGPGENPGTRQNKRGCLDMIQYMAKVYARELMDRGIDEPDLIIKLLNVARLATDILSRDAQHGTTAP